MESHRASALEYLLGFTTMPLDDFQKIALDAYRGALGRLRWLVLATITLSALLIGHLYSEYGFTASQLKKVAIRKELSYSLSQYDFEANKKELQSKIEAKQQKTGPGPTEQELDEFAEHALGRRAGDNTYDKYMFPDRVVPFLNFTVYWNDYPIIVGLLLAILTVPVWLTATSIHSALDLLYPVTGTTSELAEHNEIRQLARLFFLFTPGRTNSKWPLIVQFSAVWLPWFSLALALLLDMGPALYVLIVNHKFVIPQGALVVRVSLYFVLLLIVFVSSFYATRAFISIDKRLK